MLLTQIAFFNASPAEAYQQLHYIAGDKYNGYKGEFYYTDRTGEPVDGFVFKLGIDF